MLHFEECMAQGSCEAMISAGNDQPRQVKEYMNDKGDSLLPREIVYKQASKVIGLRDKLVTQQDALQNSEDPPRYLPRQDPLSLPRHPLCHPA
ncbi:hypothetical protein V6N13_023138 [Hibiscus sabdariffa]